MTNGKFSFTNQENQTSKPLIGYFTLKSVRLSREHRPFIMITQHAPFCRKGLLILFLELIKFSGGFSYNILRWWVHFSQKSPFVVCFDYFNYENENMHGENILP